MANGKLSKYLSSVADRNHNFQHSKAGPEVFFQATYNNEGESTCVECNISRHGVREESESKDEVVVRYGTIASGNQEMKDANRRDKIGINIGGVLCFEIEATGLMNNISCFVISSICNYSDSQKLKKWQLYVAGTIAACAKDSPSVILPDQLSKTRMYPCKTFADFVPPLLLVTVKETI